MKKVQRTAMCHLFTIVLSVQLNFPNKKTEKSPLSSRFFSKQPFFFPETNFLRNYLIDFFLYLILNENKYFTIEIVPTRLLFF